MLSRRLVPRTAAHCGAVAVAGYARWCTSVTPAATGPSRTSMDPADIIAKCRALTSPCEAYPATSGVISGPTDPKILWREHWDVTNKAPYYENVATYEVTCEIPEGFPTRFGSYWVGKGYNVIDDLVQPKGTERPKSVAASDVTTYSNTSKTMKTQRRQFSMSSTRHGIKAAPEGTDPSKMTMKQRIALYGTAGMVLYLIIHNTLLFIIFVMLYFFKVDLVAIARSYGYELKFLGGAKKEAASADGADTVTEEEIVADPSLIATFITAVALCKMVVPIQLTLTLALAPSVAPRLNVLIQRVKARWGYGPTISTKV